MLGFSPGKCSREENAGIGGLQRALNTPKPGTREAAVAFTSGPACLSRPDWKELTTTLSLLQLSHVFQSGIELIAPRTALALQCPASTSGVLGIYRCTSLCLVILGLNPRASHVAGKHFTYWAIASVPQGLFVCLSLLSFPPFFLFPRVGGKRLKIVYVRIW